MRRLDYLTLLQVNIGQVKILRFELDWCRRPKGIAIGIGVAYVWRRYYYVVLLVVIVFVRPLLDVSSVIYLLLVVHLIEVSAHTIS